MSGAPCLAQGTKRSSFVYHNSLVDSVGGWRSSRPKRPWYTSQGWPSSRVAAVGLWQRQTHSCQNHDLLAKQRYREGAPHTNGSTFLLITGKRRVRATTHECGGAQWLTVAGSLDGERARRARSTGMESEHERLEVYRIRVKGHL